MRINALIILALLLFGFTTGRWEGKREAYTEKLKNRHVIQGMEISGRCFIIPGNNPTSYKENHFVVDENIPCTISPTGIQVSNGGENSKEGPARFEQ